MKEQQPDRTSRNRWVCRSGCEFERQVRGRDSELNPDSGHSDIYFLNAVMASLRNSLLQLDLCLETAPKLST